MARTGYRLSQFLPAIITLVVSLIVALQVEPMLRWFVPGQPDMAMVEMIRTIAASLALFAGAHLLHSIVGNRLLRPRKGRRPVPKVLLDLFRVLLFVLATLISLSLIFRQDLSGILTGSGLVLAVLGFAIRNVVEDVFSGLALGIEAPFRIGDWVRIEGLAQGRILEIGWRTTRLVTRDSTYVILPNSQISRQRITNFSAPRQEYRDHIDLVLPHDTPVADMRAMVKQALRKTRSLMPERKSEITVTRYGPEGITYRVKFWVPQHDREISCRNEVFSAIDRVLRENDIELTTRLPMQVVTDPDNPVLSNTARP